MNFIFSMSMIWGINLVSEIRLGCTDNLERLAVTQFSEIEDLLAEAKGNSLQV